MFETEIHGTCSQVRELKIEVVCVIVHDQSIVNAPCFKNADDEQIEFKSLPASPRYK